MEPAAGSILFASGFHFALFAFAHGVSVGNEAACCMMNLPRRTLRQTTYRLACCALSGLYRAALQIGFKQIVGQTDL